MFLSGAGNRMWEMIGPGGLLLLVPHLFAVPVSVLSVELQKSTYMIKQYVGRVTYWALLEMLVLHQHGMMILLFPIKLL
jgi:hypothetical protein